jgi:DNA-binding transcriptional ArsR family regulator
METLSFNLQEMQTAASQACRLMKVLANQDRLIILCQLTKREMCVGEIKDLTGIQQPTLSQQLTVLREESLVKIRREGKNIFYQINDPKALVLMGVLYELFCNQNEG